MHAIRKTHGGAVFAAMIEFIFRLLCVVSEGEYQNLFVVLSFHTINQEVYIC
jgi:hypothetical protein